MASTVLYSLMTVFIRVQGSIGLHSALKFRMKCYSKNFRKFLAIYLEVPTLELFGFWAGLKEQSLALFFNLQAGNDNLLMSVVSKAVPMEAFPSLEMVEVLTLKYYPAFVLAIIAFGLFNVLKTKYFGQIRIHYPNNVVVNVPKRYLSIRSQRVGQAPS